MDNVCATVYLVDDDKRVVRTPERLRTVPQSRVVVLRPEDWAAWVYLTKSETELLRPLPEGSLTIETVRAVAEAIREPGRVRGDPRVEVGRTGGRCVGHLPAVGPALE